MLKKEFAPGVLWFEDFDDRDLAWALGTKIRWLRITRCQLEELPQLQYQTGAHIYIQKSRDLKSASLDGAASVELEDCFAFTSHSFKGIDHVVQLKLRNLTKMESLSFLASSDVKALWIERRPTSLQSLGDALSLSNLQILWASPFGEESMKQLSKRLPDTWMCNGVHAFHDGAAFADLTAFYEAAGAAGLHELTKRPHN